MSVPKEITNLERRRLLRALEACVSQIEGQILYDDKVLDIEGLRDIVRLSRDELAYQELYIRNSNAGDCLLTLMVGPAGSGKSTLAEALCAQWQAVHLSSDALRERFCGSRADHSQDERIFSYIYAQAEAHILHGVPVVIDASHLFALDRLRAVRIVPEGTFVRYVVVNRPLQDKLLTRGSRPIELVERHHVLFELYKDAILSGDNLANVLVENRIQRNPE